MKYWIILSNSSKFDFARFLSLHGNIVDWKQSAKFKVGDIVYIYCTKPEMRIRYKMKVTETNIPFAKSLKDETCWKDKLEFKAGIENNKYFRMTLVAETNTHLLTMDNLHQHGVKGYFYGPRSIDRELIMYIDKSFNKS